MNDQVKVLNKPAQNNLPKRKESASPVAVQPTLKAAEKLVQPTQASSETQATLKVQPYVETAFKSIAGNATALAEKVLLTSVFKDLALSSVAIICLFVLLREMFSKKPDYKTKMTDFHQTSQVSPPRLIPLLEERLEANLRQSILAEENLVAVHSGTKTIYITSAGRGEGKTATALSLAYSLMKGSGNTVLLIDGAVGHPDLHNLLGTPKEPGLINALTEQIDIKDTVIETAYPRLSFIPFGISDADSATLDNPEALKLLLAQLRDSYKYIIFDGSSMWGTPHTALISTCFDGVLFAVEAEKTKWEMVQGCREKIQRINGNVLGVVLNKRNFYIPSFLYGKI